MEPPPKEDMVDILPHLLDVRSATIPIIGSETASQTRITNISKVASTNVKP